MASNQVQAIQNATTPQEVAVAYANYSQSLTSAGQTPKPLSDLI